MGSLYSKGLVIDSLRKYVSGVQSEEQRLTEEQQHCLITLNTIFGADVVAYHLGKERGSYLPLFRSFIEYSDRVEKQNTLGTE